MKKTAIAVLFTLAAAVASAQQSAAPAAPAKMDHDACMKMGSAHASEAQAKHDAAWKAIQTDLAAAKKATGEKKVAALEAVLEKLVALHGEMRQGSGAGMMAASNGHSMDCCAGKAESAMASKSPKKMDCCGAGSDCCGGGMACCNQEAAGTAAPARK